MKKEQHEKKSKNRLKKFFNKKVLEGNNPFFDKFIFKFFETINEAGKFLSPKIVKQSFYNYLLDYLLEVLPGYESAQPLLGGEEEQTTFISYKKKRFLEKAEPGDVVLIRGNQRIGRIIQTLTKSPYSHSAYYKGDGNLIEAEPEGVLISPIDKYLHLDIRICRPTMLSEKGKKIVADHMDQMLQQQPKYDVTNIEQLLFKYLYTKFRPDIKVYIGGSTKFETYYICSGMIAHGFHKADYPITPTLRIKNHGKRISNLHLDNVEDYVEMVSHLKKNYSQIVPADFDNSSFFASIKFLFFDYHDMLDQNNISFFQEETEKNQNIDKDILLH